MIAMRVMQRITGGGARAARSSLRSSVPRLFSSSSKAGPTGQRTFAMSAGIAATGAAIALWANIGQVS